jgi:energy-coupling factor transport system ATP-binding protein
MCNQVIVIVLGKNLSFSYAQPDDESELSPPALRGLNISVNKCEFIAVVGHNGSGKSTFAKHLNALLSPADGTLWIDGMDTRDPSLLWDIRRTACMVFQNPDNQIVATVVEEDVAFGPENLGLPSQEIHERVGESLAAVGMSNSALSAPHHLSGGQKQRIAIAGVLAMRPGLIVLDEPTAMLDPSGRREVLDAVIRLNREEGITVMLITHFMEEAALADRILVMAEGRAVMDGAPMDIFRRDGALRDLGLSVPQATALGNTLRERGVPVGGLILNAANLLADEAVFALARGYSGKPVGRVVSALLPPRRPLIEIKNLTHTYNAGAIFEKKAIDGINLDINHGEILGIIGHTGSGKSTLIQHLNALLRPTSGHILVDGVDIHLHKKNLKSLRQRVGLVFQYPEHQLFEQTVYEDVAFGPSHLGLGTNEIDKRVKNALAAVGLDESVYKKSPFTLSSGQKRRLAIAGVLAMEPEVLILDEPTAGLDPQGRREILAQVQHMHKRLGLTVVLVSHGMDDVACLCGRIVVMNRGEIALTGPPEAVFSQGDLLEAMGLAVPQISHIMSELAKINPSIPMGIYTVEEAADVLAGHGEINPPPEVSS